ncbi:MAG: hypothetical protein KGP06_01150 [Acidobacteria bacterium]|nr:hypothetical protein [Acidobacteriota bacterium]
MDFSHLTLYIGDREWQNRNWKRVDSDEKSENSRIRRKNQKFDEELYRIRGKNKATK